MATCHGDSLTSRRKFLDLYAVVLVVLAVVLVAASNCLRQDPSIPRQFGTCDQQPQTMMPSGNHPQDMSRRTQSKYPMGACQMASWFDNPQTTYHRLVHVAQTVYVIY